MVSKSNKQETCLQKISNPLINERHMLLDSYFYTHITSLLDFDMNDMVSFDTKYFLHFYMDPKLFSTTYNQPHWIVVRK